MEQYIDKFAVVAEIKRRISLFQKEKNVEEASQTDVISLGARAAVLEEILSFLGTLDVKKVDLKKEIYDAEKRFGDIDEMGGYRILIFDDDFRDILRHFFELGNKAQKGE